ncbi:MAG: M20 family metallopeptidase [Candidatus Dormiibacterota bacterium]
MSPLDRSADLPSLRTWLGAQQARWVESLEELVRCESPSGDHAALNECADIVERLFRRFVPGFEAERVEHDEVPSLLLRWGSAQSPGVLLLGHLDTVWDKGAFQPLFAVTDGRAQGPGVFDMKGGVVVGLAALAALQAEADRSGRVSLLLTGDEEVGSAASQSLIESAARKCSAVLVLEPPVLGALKVARKGVAAYRLAVRGRAAHAGLDPEQGVNSLVGIAPLVAQVAALARPEQGTTVSPTRLRGGSRVNVIPAESILEIDVRYATAAEAARVDTAMRGLQPDLVGATLEVSGGSNRPPFEASSSARLFAIAREVAAQLDWAELAGTSVGGGSDGNFTAALGIPTLDGLGIVGGNAHAAGEWAELETIPDRAALVAGCVSQIWDGGQG